jgi:hypothetical protein
MTRLLGTTILAGLCAVASGCAMCCAPYDCDYPTVAGTWVRTNPSGGRVGSAFDPAGIQAIPDEMQSNQRAPEPSPAPGTAEPPMTLPPPARQPATRSVIPRRMGESYLPTQP